MKTTEATEEQVTEIRELLIHEDPGHQQQGLELAKALGDWSPVLAGCGIGEDGRVAVSFGELNSTILELMLTAPGFDASTVERLHLGYSDLLVDLSPLTALKNLTSLSFQCPALVDLSPLRELVNLKSLSLMGDLEVTSSLSDLEPLKELVNLEYLDLSHTSVRDLRPLKGLTKLEHLSCWYCDLKTLDGLEGLALGSLSLSDTSMNDYSGLVHLKSLHELYLSCCTLTDLSPLSSLTNLTTLLIDGCSDLNDLSPLKSLTNLRYLNVVDCLSLTDLSPLRELNNLRKLEVNWNYAEGPLADEYAKLLTALPEVELFH